MKTKKVKPTWYAGHIADGKPYIIAPDEYNAMDEIIQERYIPLYTEDQVDFIVLNLPVSRELILANLEAHLKTKEHRREDLDYVIGKKHIKVKIYNNDWGSQQEQGFREAMKVIAKINFC